MPGETITLQVGQCGNQAAVEFWKRAAFEHGIGADGSRAPHVPLGDRPDVYFYETDGRWIPRAVLIDSESMALGSLLHGSGIGGLFPRDSVFDNVVQGAGGAGNCWATGYTLGRQSYVVHDMIRREAESCDSMKAISLWHSLAGGTGSGFGSYLLEYVADAYPRRVISTVSVLPSRILSSDATVQPYNSVLTMKRITECADMAFMFDNERLLAGEVVRNALQQREQAENDARGAAGFMRANEKIASVINMVSGLSRFPTYAPFDLATISATLVPTPRLNLISPALTPGPSLSERSLIAQTYTSETAAEAPLSAFYTGAGGHASVGSVLRELPKSSLVDFRVDGAAGGAGRPGVLVGATAFVSGPGATHNALHAATAATRDLRFVPWGPANFQTILARRSEAWSACSRGHVGALPPVQGVMLANTTGVRHPLQGIYNSFSTLYSRRVFMRPYQEALGEAAEEEFESAAESLLSTINEYERAESADYLTADD